MPPRTPGRRITTSSTSLPAVDVLKHVHNTFDGYHRPTRQDLTCIEEGGFDYVETTKDTSPRRAPSFLPAVDVSKHVHNMFDGSHKPTRRKSRCFNEVGIDYDENMKDTSVRRVPTVLHHPSTFQPVVDASNRVYNLPNTSHSSMHRESSRFDEITIGYHRNTKDTSPGRVPPFLLAEDVSKHGVHNASGDSHNPTHRPSTRLDAYCIDFIKNTENTSVRCVPPSRHPSHTAGHRITTSTAHPPAMDLSKHVHNSPNAVHNPTTPTPCLPPHLCLPPTPSVARNASGGFPPSLCLPPTPSRSLET
jgi:hypothetical protein